MRRLSALWRQTSLRVAILSSVLFVLTLSVVGFVAEERLEATLKVQAQTRAEATANELVDEYKREGLNGLWDSVAPRLHGGERRVLYALVGSEGRLLLGDRALCAGVLACLDGVSGTREEASRPPLVVRRELRPDGMFLAVVDDLSYIQDVRSIVAKAFWYAVAVTLLAGGAIGYVMSRYILRQLGSIALTAEAISSGDLTRRITAVRSADEFDGLRNTLNRMLDRITDLLRNVQQVSTDIAHDLRTPLSRLRHRLEREEAKFSPGDSRQKVIHAAIGELDAVLETFSALLRIAQIESGRQHSAFRHQDVSDILDDVGQTYKPVAEESGRVLVTTAPAGLVVCGDRELLTQLFCNLVENALTHTPPGTVVEVRADKDDDRVLRVTVDDNGPGIAPCDRPFVFRRLYRGERSRSTPGTGLGLTLVSAIVDLHHGTIGLDDNGPGLKASVTLPLVEPVAEAPPLTDRPGRRLHWEVSENT